MNWWDGEFVAFDLETTGTDLEEARIVTVCVSTVHSDGSIANTLELTVNPGIEIPVEASNVHGITTEIAATVGLAPEDALRGVTNILGDALDMQTPLVAFNARFDFTILDRECRRHHMPPLQEMTAGVIAPVLDPFVLDKAVDKYRKGKRTLAAMCDLYGVELVNAHNATADAIAAAQVARAIIRRYRGLQMPASALHQAQELWARQQATSLERYFRQQGGNPTLVLDKDWPMVPAGEVLL
ncbi:exonuclease domain-containing protein [Streptomyces atratus]|uniref:exonuclease domain-containing protein n=1 Tax=Streptomyces atratus TaxID=1893 RepID=UPI00365408EF